MPSRSLPQSRLSESQVDRSGTTTTGKRIKGLFSRRVLSPAPDVLTIRSRLRSFIDDTSRGGLSRPRLSKLSDKAAFASTTSHTAGDTKKRPLQARERVVRPFSPDQVSRAATRVAPSMLPAMQKGEDGRWQPPSLSRGSMSTSDLAIYSQEFEEDKEASVVSLKIGQGGSAVHKPALAVLVNPMSTSVGSNASGSRKKNVEVKSAMVAPDRPVVITQSSPATSRKRVPAADSQLSPGSATPVSDANVSSRTRSSATSPVAVHERPSRQSSKRSGFGFALPAQLNPRFDPPHQSASSSNVRSAPPSPSVRSEANPPLLASSVPLSFEHYHLRLASSYLVRILTPVIRDSGFLKQDKLTDIKRRADEHLTALARMEKGWGSEWNKASARAERTNGTREVNETRSRAVHVSDRVKERERQLWFNSMRDGLLLCLLLNHLFPSNPQHISRLNMTEDGILRSVNAGRFRDACRKLALPEPNILAICHLQDVNEVGLGRVAWNVIALAQHASRQHAAIKPASAEPASKYHDIATALQTSIDTESGAIADPGPKGIKAGGEPAPEIASANMPVTSDAKGIMRSAEQQGSPSRKDVSSSISNRAITAKKTPDDPFTVEAATTTSAQTAVRAPSPLVLRRSPSPRSTTQPNMPLRVFPPSSATSSPSRSPLLPHHSLAAAGRPTLRPRYTTGSSLSASSSLTSPGSSSPRQLAFDRIGSTATTSQTGLHGRERSPSLISSGSSVTSGYTRSSMAMSVYTLLGEEHSTAVDTAEVEDSDPHSSLTSSRIRERRMSARTLQNARQKIMHELLGFGDLPEDLRKALEHDFNGDPRNVAIGQSLAALEGWKSPRNATTDSSPCRSFPGPASRSGDVARVSEEDGVSPASSIILDSPKPTLVRRKSASGKVYVPKRSISSSPRDGNSSPARHSPLVPVNRGVPHGTPSRTNAIVSPIARPGSRNQCGQSDGSALVDDVSRPHITSRNCSMTDVSAGGSSLKDTRIQGKQSQVFEILAIRDPGLPAVKYQVGNCVGRGQFGSVYRALNLSTGQMVAIKRIKLEGIDAGEAEDVMREVELLQKLSHPSIVQYKGMMRDDKYLNILLEYIENGSLVQTIKSFGAFNEQLCASYVAKILEGLDYLHSQGVVHCDLKAANILSTKNGNVKLSDFGVSLTMKAVKNLQQGPGSVRGDHNPRQAPEAAIQGSPNWMAPEVINMQGARASSDIWSLGCTIIEMLTGRPPYSDLPNSMAVLWHIVMDTKPPIPIDVTGDLRDFLELCFIKDPDARPAAVILFEHPWIKKLNPDLALRPQDSVPFLRRVSMDLPRTDSAQLFPPLSASSSTLDLNESTPRKRLSLASSRSRETFEGAVKEHEMVKTTFSKPILCRICHSSVKKGGILCHSCGLICHAGCVSKAPVRCDVAEQLALLSRQQDFLAEHPNQEIRSAAPSRRQSLDFGEQGTGTPLTQLPARIFSGLKRTRSAPSSEVYLPEERRQLSSTVDREAAVTAYGSRPSLDATARNSSSQSRASGPTAQSTILLELEPINDAEVRTVSAVRFESAKKSQTREVDQSIDKKETPAAGSHMHKHWGHKSRDSKSDCLLM